MANKRIKRVQSLWSIKYSECIGELQEANKEKDLIVPIITMIMQKESKALGVEYLKYCSHKYPLTKLSNEEWIDGIVNSWKTLTTKQDAYTLMLHRLNGISDKENWNGKNPKLEDVHA